MKLSAKDRALLIEMTFIAQIMLDRKAKRAAKAKLAKLNRGREKMETPIP